MAERVTPQHDEHVFERERATLERIAELAQKGDPLYQRFRSWISKRASDRVPQRGESKKVQTQKNTRLMRDYMRYLERIFLPRTAEGEPHEPGHRFFTTRHYQNVRSEHVSRDLPAEYARFQRAVQQARGQEFDSAAELQRIQADQGAQLVEWLDRLTQYDHYTPAFQYLMWRTIAGLSSARNGTEGNPRFLARDANTVAPLPQFHELAVGYLEELILAYDRSPGNRKPALEDVFTQPFFETVEDDSAWKKRIEGLLENNAINELYATLSALVTEYEEGEGPVEGRWITVTKDGIKDELTKAQAKAWSLSSLTKKGDGAQMLKDLSSATPWCLRFKATAQSYLTGGKKLLIFVENTSKGPRPAFGVAFDKNGVVYQARGANDRQELAPRYADVVDARMEIDQPPGWENYAERLKDAQTLAAAERFLNRPNLKPFDQLKPEEQDRYRQYLRAIYELDRKLVGFGYGENTYAKKVREGRDAMRDAEIIFGPYAKSAAELDSMRLSGVEPQAFIGSISADLWDKLGAVEHIYTSFPEGRIPRRNNVLEATTIENIRTGLREKRASIGTYADDMLGKIPDKDLQSAEAFPTYSLQVRDLFTPEELKKLGTRLPTTKDIFGEQGPDGNFDLKRIHRLGLDVCPATVAPHILLKLDKTLSAGQWEFIAMQPIPGRDGGPRVFVVGRDGDGSLELDYGWAIPGDGWGRGRRLVLRPRKLELSS